ncbi:MAG: AAA family ATPase [Cyclobacteriaceae bacterium]
MNENSEFTWNNDERTTQDFDEMAAQGNKLPPILKIWGNYILQRGLFHFVSERGTGKTFLCMQLCLAVAKGWKEFCTELIQINGNTLYVNLEMEHDFMKRRMDTLFKKFSQDLDGPFKAIMHSSNNNFATERSFISELVKKYKPVLVVIDNYKFAFREFDPNKSNVAMQIMSDLRRLTRDNDIAIVVIDHTKKHTRNLKTESDLQGGSGSKSDAFDGDFFIRKSSKDVQWRILKRDKSRMVEDQRMAKLLRLNPETLWFEMQEEEIDEMDHLNGDMLNGKDEAYDLAKVMKENGATMDQIKAATGIPLSTLYRKLK